jgi:hypothetical protein
VITNKSRVVVGGIGPATVVVAAAHESVFQFVDCTDVTVQSLRAESGQGPAVPARLGEQHLLGTVTFLGSPDATVRDCELSCPDSAGPTQSAVYAAPSSDAGTGQVRVLANKLEIGDQQIGVLVVSADEVTVDGNEIRLATAPSTPTRPVLVLPALADEVARFVSGHVATAATEATHTVALPANLTLRVRGPSDIQRLADEFGANITESALRGATPRQLLQRFTRTALVAPHTVEISRKSSNFLAATVSNSRTMAQGIVIGGVQANLVRIRGNIVRGAIQGIHIGLAGANGAMFNAGEVIVHDNVVASAVPFFWGRSRHAYYVGSVERLSMLDNSASLVRIGGSTTSIRAFGVTPVEAVRIHGRSGPWLSVRGLSLTGQFSVGVAITDLSVSQKGLRQHYVSDVLNSAGTGPGLRPTTIAHDRCAP